MRIAVVNWTSRRVGGAESYLDSIVPEMHRTGHELAFLWEVDVPANYQRITLPAQSAQWTTSKIGRVGAIEAVRDWRPDVIYVHRIEDPELESAVLQVAPAVLFAHDYSRTCISGSKTFGVPTATPCVRRFGWKCLVHYYPHRCGGMNPFTMWQLYRSRVERFPNLDLYGAIVTASDHMRTEYLNHGLPIERVRKIAYPVPRSGAGGSASRVKQIQGRDRRLLFVGRMVSLKGGCILLKALPQVVRALRGSTRMTFVGSGPEQAAWQAEASRMTQQGRLRIEFTGWLESAQLGAMLDESDLLVLPSLWPEPFGLVGIEAGSHAVPAAAFAVGGTQEWLFNGVNGYLAPGSPPTAAGLAEAIIKCLRDPIEHGRLRRGAIEVARRFTAAAHASELLSVLELVANARRPSTAARAML